MIHKHIPVLAQAGIRALVGGAVPYEKIWKQKPCQPAPSPARGVSSTQKVALADLEDPLSAAIKWANHCLYKALRRGEKHDISFVQLMEPFLRRIVLPPASRQSHQDFNVNKLLLLASTPSPVVATIVTSLRVQILAVGMAPQILFWLAADTPSSVGA